MVNDTGSVDLRIAYFLRKFPKLSETFITSELSELDKYGIRPLIISLERVREDITHYGYKELAENTIYLEDYYNYLLPFRILISHAYFLMLSPRRYLSTLVDTIKLKGGRRLFIKDLWIARILKDNDISIIHSHFAWENTTYAMVLSKLLGIKYTFVVHGHDLFVEPKHLEDKITDASIVFVDCEYFKEHILSEYPHLTNSKLKKVFMGVDTRKIVVRKETMNEKFIILSIARLVEKKGLIYLLEACKYLKNQNIQFKCKLLGEGHDRKILENYIKMNDLQDVVSLKGALNYSMKIDLLQEADLFVLPCVIAESGDRDALPVAIKEAMAMGIPVISTNEIGIPEMIKDGCGILVPPRDGKKLAIAIEAIYQMSSEERRLMGLKGREILEREFNLAKETKKIVETWKSL